MRAFDLRNQGKKQDVVVLIPDPGTPKETWEEGRGERRWERLGQKVLSHLSWSMHVVTAQRGDNGRSKVVPWLPHALVSFYVLLPPASYFHEHTYTLS